MPAAPRRPEGQTASAAGGDTGPSQRGSGAAAAAVRRGRSTIARPPQPPFSAASPAGTRARPLGARAPSRAAAAARARAHLQPRRRRRRLAPRPRPIGSAHLRLRRQPIGTQPAGLARPVGGPRGWRAPPTASRLVLRCEGGAGSPEARGPLWIELGSGRTHAPAVEFPPREGDGAGRPEARAHLDCSSGGCGVLFFSLRMRESVFACWVGSRAAVSLTRPSHRLGMRVQPFPCRDDVGWLGFRGPSSTRAPVLQLLGGPLKLLWKDSSFPASVTVTRGRSLGGGVCLGLISC